jgi:two-component sensor histidine kinase
VDGASRDTPADGAGAALAVGGHAGGLKRRLTLVFVGVVTVVLGLGGALNFHWAHEAYEDHLRENLQLQSALIAESIDGDEHAAIEGPASPAYARIREALVRFRELNPKVRDIYTMSRGPDGRWRYVVDAEPDGGTIFSPFGTPYDGVQDPALPRGLSGPVASAEVYRDEYGEWLSGYAPIRASDGSAVGVVGVDVDSETYWREERQIAALNLLVFAVGVLLSVAAGRYLLARVADPVVVEQSLQIAASRQLESERDRALETARAEHLRRTHEAQFHALFEHAPDAMLIVGPHQLVESANDPARAIWPGLSRGDEVPAALQPGIEAVWSQSEGDPDARLSRRSVQLTLDTPAGQIDGEALCAPIPLGGGIGALVVVRNITRRRRAERDLQDALARVSQALAEREVLVKEVHHRVKNNLQIVSSLLEMQADRADPAARHLIHDGVARIRALSRIHQMLYAGDDLARVDLGQYAETMVGELWRSLGAQGRWSVVADPVEMSMDQAIPCGLILNELVTNALKHGRSADGACRLRVEVRADADAVRMVVADEGPGVPPGFESQPSATLGTKVLRSLARQLQGELTVTSEGGARFTLVVPRAPVAA